MAAPLPPSPFTSSTPAATDPLQRGVRLGGAAMVAVAAVLPVRDGGRIICPLRLTTGIPCPFCGMTHGVVATVHGQLDTGFAHNPLAPMLVLAVVVLWVFAALRRTPHLPPWLLSPRVALSVLAVVELVQLHHFGFV